MENNQDADEMKRDQEALADLISTAAALTAERDIRTLLALILTRSRAITVADAGSVYVLQSQNNGQDELRFEVAQNDSVEIDFQARTVPVSSESIAGAAAIEKKVIYVNDLSSLDNDNPWGVHHDNRFDRKAGYITRNMLTVPMINPRDEVIGVIQLINRKRDRDAVLIAEEDVDRWVVAFDRRAIDVAKTLAYQAAIALDNALLFDELQAAFQGFVEASVSAIEARDPTTSGHSRRVADLTVALARATERTNAGNYADLSFSDDELIEIEWAGLLHDFGKVGVPERVLIKPQKLFSWDFDRVSDRFDYIFQWLKNEMLCTELRALRGVADQRAIEAELNRIKGEIDFLVRAREIVCAANRPSVLDQACSDMLDEIANRRYVNSQGELQPYLTAAELDCLRITRGSLNNEERSLIESHVIHSVNFLCRIPWGRAFRRVPEIAAAHHEKLDGSGYPRGRCAEEIPVQARMMTISDIFDALTAADRPYKPALPVERALDILGDEVKHGKLDSDLFGIFVDAKVFQVTSVVSTSVND